MKKIIILIFFFSNLCFGQDQSAYKSGEWLNFKLSYSGWIKAGKANQHKGFDKNGKFDEIIIFEEIK